jgi:hypothetical protein
VILFRTMSQLEISYRHCSLNAGKAGDIDGGASLGGRRWALIITSLSFTWSGKCMSANACL